jgi:hypothetical protein
MIGRSAGRRAASFDSPGRRLACAAYSGVGRSPTYHAHWPGLRSWVGLGLSIGCLDQAVAPS